MDKNQVFIKTEQGEQAVRQRTRLVQRNLRNVLIMVDGHSTVAELGDRFGDARVVWNALVELEHNGFIESFERRIVREMNSNGQGCMREGSDPVPPAPPAVAPVIPDPALPAAMGASRDSSPNRSAAVSNDPVASTAFPPHRDVPAAPRVRVRERLRALTDTTQGLLEIGRTTISRLKARAAREPRRKPPARETTRRASRKPLQWGMYIKASLAVSAVAAIAAVMLLPFVPLDRWKDEVESVLSKAAGERVAIDALHIVWWPVPGVRAEDLKLEDGSIRAASVFALPDYLSLLGSQPALHEVRIDGLQVSAAGLVRIGALAAGVADRRPALAVRKLSFVSGSFGLADMRVGDLQGEVAFGPRNQVVEAHVRNRDASFAVRLAPAAGRIETELTARQWKMPLPPYLSFEILEGSGELTPGGWSFSRLDGTAYDGRLSGKARLEWEDSVAIMGDFELRRANLARMLADVDAGVSGAGEANVHARFDARADRFSGLPDTLRVKAAYKIARGEIDRFGIAEAVHRRGRPMAGSATQFEELSGRLTATGGGYRLSDLRMTAGLLHARGHLAVGRDKQLDGVLDVEIRGTASVVKTALRVTGKLDDPRLGIAPMRTGAPTRPPAEGEQHAGDAD